MHSKDSQPIGKIAQRLSLRTVLFVVLIIPGLAHAHFSYSDPRIIHLVEQDSSHSSVLVRMPAPLAFLPDDWSGEEDARIPPFAVESQGTILLDAEAINISRETIKRQLDKVLTLSVNGHDVNTRVTQFRIWSDTQRPRFGTLKTARASFDKPSEIELATEASYFDLTLDVQLQADVGNLSEQIQIESTLGKRFRVMEKLGTVIKLHRQESTETKAAIGLVDISFPKNITKLQGYLEAFHIGAKHIYLGFDHLGIILLIAIAAPGWRKALVWASAFTVGHMVTLIAGLYGFAPTSNWFVPVVELSIVISIVVAGFLVFLKRYHSISIVSLMIIGLIHGYGFAAASSEALFVGQIDPIDFAFFALGLELCQFAVYTIVLPLIVALDRVNTFRFSWRRASALYIAITALFAVVLRFIEVSNNFTAI